MASLTIRKLDDAINDDLRLRVGPQRPLGRGRGPGDPARGLIQAVPTSAARAPAVPPPEAPPRALRHAPMRRIRPASP